MNPPLSLPPEHPAPQQDGKPERASFLRVVGTVLSAFIGIRKRSSAEVAHQQIKPAHVVVAGIIGALVFIAILVTLVRFIIAK
jgi:amino acid transporter